MIRDREPVGRDKKNPEARVPLKCDRSRGKLALVGSGPGNASHYQRASSLRIVITPDYFRGRSVYVHSRTAALTKRGSPVTLNEPDHGAFSDI